MQQNHILMTFAQISNLTGISSTFPSVTHHGLPFGDNEPLNPPVAVSGEVIGILHPDTLVLAYFGLNDAAKLWTSGPAGVMSVAANGSYRGSIPIASDRFTAVLMRKSFWTDFLAANGGGQTAKVAEVPSAAAHPGDVLLSTMFNPGSARTINFDRYVFQQELRPAQRILPGYVDPIGPFFQPFLLPVNGKDPVPTKDYTTFEGKPVSPSSPEFARAALARLPYSGAQPLRAVPPQSAYACLVLQGSSLDPKTPGGWLSFTLYQDGGGNIYFWFAYAGPKTPMVVETQKIYSNDVKKEAFIEYYATLAFFSDDILFNIVSGSIDFQTSAFGALVTTIKKIGPKIAKTIFKIL
jgi:hypothetical protein